MATTKYLSLTGLSKYDERIKAYIGQRVAGKVTKQVVDALPAVADASEDVIYLVPNGGSESGNVKNEYMLINGAFELIGTTKTDLTDYATKEYARSQASTAGATAEQNAKDYADGKLADKQDTISDLETIRSGAAAGATAYQKPAAGVPASDLASDVQTSLGKADSALQASDIATGSANGTIKVKNSDIAVKGLGSAAYTDSTAYDAAGLASAAESSAKAYADGLASNYATAAQGGKADTAVQPADLVEITETEINTLFA